MTAGSNNSTLADWGELRFLDWLRRFLKDPPLPPGFALLVGVGDDAAQLRLAPVARDLVVTTDASIEGVHFRRQWIGPRDLGWKSLAVNLSDLAAMAARPIAAFLSLGVPPESQISDLKAFFLGLRDAGRRFGCPLVGGDLVRAPQWTIAVTALGAPEIPGRAIRRSEARPGQALFVTGATGESAAGLAALERGDRAPQFIARHRRPTPRLPEAAALVSVCPDLAMIDVSDGVRSDAGQIARASGVAVEIDVDALPISDALRRQARRAGVDPLDWALDGGEDYELLFTTLMGEATIRAAFDSLEIATPIHRIGRTVAGRGARLVDGAGRPVRRADATFRHF